METPAPDGQDGGTTPRARGAALRRASSALRPHDTLSDTVQHGLARLPADGIPMRPQKLEYGTTTCGHARTHRGRT